MPKFDRYNPPNKSIGQQKSDIKGKSVRTRNLINGEPYRNTSSYEGPRQAESQQRIGDSSSLPDKQSTVPDDDEKQPGYPSLQGDAHSLRQQEQKKVGGHQEMRLEVRKVLPQHSNVSTSRLQEWREFGPVAEIEELDNLQEICKEFQKTAYDLWELISERFKEKLIPSNAHEMFHKLAKQMSGLVINISGKEEIEWLNNEHRRDELDPQNMFENSKGNEQGERGRQNGAGERQRMQRHLSTISENHPNGDLYLSPPKRSRWKFNLPLPQWFLRRGEDGSRSERRRFRVSCWSSCFRPPRTEE